MQTLLVDNYDSYTFNLFQLIAEVNGVEPIAVRNDEPLEELGADNIVISPGPGDPACARDFGICRDLLLGAPLPVLGVCLGHEGLGWLYGGAVKPSPEVVHGRRSAIHHVGSGLFAGLPQAFEAVRYHSLIVDERGARDLERIAWTSDGLCMGLRHRRRPLWGVQFHPESVLTDCGAGLLENFARLTRELQTRRPRRHRHRRPGAGSAVPRDRARRRPHHDGARCQTRRLDRWVDPERVFDALFARWPRAVWLDSALAEEGRSRFSFMGGPGDHALSYRVGGDLTVQAAGGERKLRADLLEYLDGRLTEVGGIDGPAPPFDFVGGYVGYLGYELKADCGATAAHRSPLPDAQLVFLDRFIAFDHLRRETWLVRLHRGGRTDRWIDETAARLSRLAGEPPAPPPAAREANFRLDRDRERYVADIAECRRLLREGQTYEVCLTNRLRTCEAGDPWQTYRRLRRLNPAPFAALLRFGDAWVLSSSPERFLRIAPERTIEAKPIKGTAQRGRDPEEDARLRERLSASEKDRAENLMIVDLLRNDLGRVCEIGSVEVPKLMAIESYQTVHQMVTTVRGRLRDDLRPVDCVRAAFPGGSMTGAPKLRTMEIIDRLEGGPRGVYSGSIGYFGVDGAVDLNIVIRTIVQTPDGASIGAGGAIVIGSDPAEEFDEMLLKARAPMEAIAVSAGAETPIVMR